MLSGREMLDQDFSDEGECQSEMHGRAPPIEVQLMEIDNNERQRQADDDAPMANLSNNFSRRNNGAHPRNNIQGVFAI